MKPIERRQLERELVELHRQMAILETGRRRIVQPATMQEVKELTPEKPTLAQRIKALFRW